MLLGVFIPPLGGVVIGDYYARWRHGGMPEGERLPALNLPNLAVYALASGIAWIAKETEFGVPPVIGVVLAACGSYAVGRAGLNRRLSPTGS